MKRREFIKLSFLLSGYLLTPISLKANEGFKTLVLVELNGGNDSLNTVVPYKSEVYKKLRPTLALKSSEYKKLNNSLALNNSLKNLFLEFEKNNVAIVNGLGYEKPNLSHFRSIDIVETASKSSEYLKNGWLSEVLEYPLKEQMPCHAMVIGNRKKNLLFSSSSSVLEFKNIGKFIKQSSNLNYMQNSSNIPALKELFSKNNEIVRASSIIKKRVSSSEIEGFEDNEIALQFKECYKVIKSRLQVPVLKISQRGYDTHSAQKEEHTRLLSEFDEALGVFVQKLKKENLYKDVLIMTYSEFGRRVKENGSLGTDHGTASSHFVIGESVKGGIYGKHPNLEKLVKNNMIFTTHYRSYYNTILSGWFKKNDNRFKTYDNLKFI